MKEITEIQNLLKTDNLWNKIEIDSSSITTTLQAIPTKEGIYNIRTTAPISELLKTDVRNDNAHYNLPKKIKASSFLGQICINEDLENGYIIYNGHQKSVRQRCKEHFIGSKGTACLNLFEFPHLYKYQWWFDYLLVDDLPSFGKEKETPLYRTYLEQQYRALIGWPILCSQ